MTPKTTAIRLIGGNVMLATNEMELLLARIPDEALRQRIREEHILAVGRQADRVQRAVFDIGQQVNERLDAMFGQQQASFGATNDMLSDVRSEVRTAVGLFQETGERLTGLELTISEHTADLIALEAGRLRNHNAIQQTRGEVHEVGAAALRYYEDLSSKISEMQQLVRQFASVLALTNDVIVTIDSEHRMVWINGDTERLFGYNSSELTGQPIDMLIPERFHDQHAQYIKVFGLDSASYRRMNDRAPVRGLHKDGHEMLLQVAISKSDTNSSASYTAVIRLAPDGSGDAE